MDVLLRRLRGLPWGSARNIVLSQTARVFAASCVLGSLIACTLAQWRATWGSSGPFDRGMAAAVIAGLVLGAFCHRRLQSKWPIWLMLASSMAVIEPTWMELVASLPKLFAANSAITTEALAVVIALLSLGPAAICWSGWLSAVQQDDARPPLLGIAAGIVFTVLVGGPAWGLEVTAIAAAACGLAIGIRATWHHAENSIEVQPSDHALFPDRMLNTATWLLCGGSIAVGRHLLRHLMPQTAPTELGMIAVVVLALAGGLGIATRCKLPRSAAALGLVGLAGLGFLSRQLFDFGLHLRMMAAAYLTNAALHQLSQIAMVLAACGPAAFVAGVACGTARNPALTMCATAICLGAAITGELLLVLTDQSLMSGIACGCGILAAANLLRYGELLGTKLRMLRTAGVTAGLVSLAFLQADVDPTRPAKLLFSTQAFLGYRSGWTVNQLPYLDDARLISRRESRQGTLTLWKSRGHDLLLREAGIPRAAISARTDLSPQPAAEVLQTVFPLLVAHDSRRILLLGASGGTPLSVCVEFPVERIVCIEPDAAKLAMIRGPIAAERNFDPCTDHRVRCEVRPIELEVRTPGDEYDIVLVSSPLSSLSAGAGQFTEEFYRHTSAKLAEHGLFCQRWEGVDYGPVPLQLVAASLTRVFANVAAVEIGVGDMLFLATNSPHGLVPEDLPERLERQHVRRLLARSGWDWSTPLTLPAWDHAALKEFAADGNTARNTAANCRLALVGPRDVLRWGPKLQETQQLLTKDRTPPADVAAADAQPTSRRGRYLDWLGEERVSKDLLRRLSEVAAQAKLIGEGPDTCWLEYRKLLREELQQRPRTEIRQVALTDESQMALHPEDERRKQYFIDLGQAGNLKQRQLDEVYELEQYFEPYDPLVSLFARQETAELLKYYGHPDPAAEFTLRWHVINFAPAADRSLQNVLAAAELLLEHPEALPDSQQQFDALNGLLQTLRTRWELRSASQLKSVRLALHDVDQTLIVIEKVLAEMDRLAGGSQIAASDWPARRDVLQRLLVRPLRGYRDELSPLNERNNLNTQAALLEAKLKRKK